MVVTILLLQVLMWLVMVCGWRRRRLVLTHLDNGDEVANTDVVADGDYVSHIGGDDPSLL